MGHSQFEGASMSKKQNGKTADKTANETAKKPNPGKIVLMGAGATALAVFNIMSNGPEAPSQGAMILQYALLACGLFALVGGLVMTGTAKT
jgi:hypothetical protein